MNKNKTMSLIPKGCKIVKVNNNNIEVKRPDNFNIYLSNKEPDELTAIKLTATPDEVIKAVAMHKALIIARNYAQKSGIKLNIKRLEA